MWLPQCQLSQQLALTREGCEPVTSHQSDQGRDRNPGLISIINYYYNVHIIVSIIIMIDLLFVFEFDDDEDLRFR